MITIIGFTSYYANDHLKITNMNGDITYLTKLAEQGDAKAQTDLGHVYGNDSTQDYTKALYWYNKAALEEKPREG